MRLVSVSRLRLFAAAVGLSARRRARRRARAVAGELVVGLLGEEVVDVHRDAGEKIALAEPEERERRLLLARAHAGAGARAGAGDGAGEGAVEARGAGAGAGARGRRGRRGRVRHPRAQPQEALDAPPERLLVRAPEQRSRQEALQRRLALDHLHNAQFTMHYGKYMLVALLEQSIYRSASIIRVCTVAENKYFS